MGLVYKFKVWRPKVDVIAPASESSLHTTSATCEIILFQLKKIVWILVEGSCWPYTIYTQELTFGPTFFQKGMSAFVTIMMSKNMDQA